MKASTLYYNCDDPVRIMEHGIIKPSKVFTGISLSCWSELGSHGPFKIEFKEAEWFKQCLPVSYWEVAKRRLRRVGEEAPPTLTYYAKNGVGERVNEVEYLRRLEIAKQALIDLAGNDRYFDRIWKGFMFKDEQEYYSPIPIEFNKDDIVQITFMVNAPCVISQRKLRQIKEVLKTQYSHLYNERKVDDPYLKNR